MNITKQVCSLDLAKRLKELGVKQDAIFKYIQAEHPSEKNTSPMLQHTPQNEQYDNTLVHDGWTLTSWAAFSVAELGELLPGWLNGHMLTISKGSDWFLRYIDYTKNTYLPNEHQREIEGDNEADARAELLIYLIQHNLWEPTA